MAPLRIRVYDDDPELAKGFAKNIAAGSRGVGHDISPIPDGEFIEALRALGSRQAAIRKGEPLASSRPNLFDNTDILVLDYDLRRDDDSGSILTGESVAYFVRTFSRCGPIIMVNEFGGQTFDLGLTGHPESNADLNLSAQDLSNAGLWISNRSPPYRPWSWPVLPDLAARFRLMVEEVERNLRAPLKEFFQFPSGTLSAMPRDAAAFVDDPQSATFETVARARAKPRDRELLSNEGLARLGAAAVHSWLEGVLLPGQNILVDAPHMVHRYPSLLRSGVGSVRAWNSTAMIGDFRLKSVRVDSIKAHAFARKSWLTRPAWWSDPLSNDSNLQEVREPWKTKRAEFVFCEDTSRFHKEGECREFVCAVATPFVRRYVRIPLKGEVAYQPAVRFALGE